MNNLEFYDIVDSEIDEILIKYADEENLKLMKETSNRKSYGFLLWFLENNLKNEISKVDKWRPFIVDGEDDNSCDLIFSNKEKDEDVFYIVQAKWFAKSNCDGNNGITNIYKSCLTDFSMLINHQKAESPTNKKFNEMYRKLQKHIDNNGKVRFLLVALCATDKDFRIEELNEYIHSPLVETQVYDLVSMKNTYIDSTMRGYVTDNPLANVDPINGKIDIDIRKGGALVVKDNDTYVFLMGAQHISSLFERFGTRLFLKNVRNPLTVTANQKMEDSALNEPENFFGYNNGITAITKEVYPFYNGAGKISVSGIQIINGAQTVKSIAEAYKKAKSAKRKEMAEKLIISMKMIVVDDPKLEQDIIQFTNTQTPILPRDYHSNDIIQRTIYYDLLRYTDIIYERKRGEFEDAEREQNRIVTNEEMAQAYIAYKLQNPYVARTAKGVIFAPETGMYEKIFNEDIDYRDLYNSYEVYTYVDKRITALKKEKKGNAEAEKQYKYLKDGRYYITALIKRVYPEVDTVFNDAYKRTNDKKKRKGEPEVNKEAMARSFFFQRMCEHDESALEESYEKAREIIEKYYDMLDGGSVYGSKKSYENMLAIYEEKDEEIILEKAVDNESEDAVEKED